MLQQDASIPDIALEPDKAVRKVQDRFRLDLSEEEAVHLMQSIIDVRDLEGCTDRSKSPT